MATLTETTSCQARLAAKHFTGGGGAGGGGEGGDGRGEGVVTELHYCWVASLHWCCYGIAYL